MKLEILENREVPAAFNPTFYQEGFQPIPGWDGPVETTPLDANGDGSEDVAYVAGLGGSVRVVVYSGGALGSIEPVPGNPGLVRPTGADSIIFDSIVFEPSFRGGGVISAINREGAPDLLVIGAGVGGGSRVRMLALDGSVDKSWFAFDDPDYRGGVFLTQTTVTMNDPVEDHIFGKDIIVTPRVGGGPLVSVFDEAGDIITKFLVGPEDDRSGRYQVFASDVLLPDSQRNGIYITDSNGLITAFDWSGNLH